MDIKTLSTCFSSRAEEELPGRDSRTTRPWTAIPRPQPISAQPDHHADHSPAIRAALLDAYICGFALLEASLPSQAEGEFVGVVEDVASTLDAYPNLVGFTVEHVFQPGYEFSDTFEVGLDIILEAVSDFARET